MRKSLVCFLLLWIASPALTDDTARVQPAAINQPRINLIVRRQVAGQPLMADDAFNVEAFLDTGASSIDLSSHTAALLGIKREKIGQTEARFQDVGVGGGSDFAVSEPLFLSIAPMTPTINTDQKDAI